MVRKIALLAALLLGPPLLAQTAPPFRPGVSITDANPSPVKSMCWNSSTSVWAPCGAPAAAGGDASASNQQTQISAEQAIRDRIGDTASPAAGTVNARLNQLYGAVTGPVPAGTATIGNVGGVQTPGSAVSGGAFRMSLKDSAGLAQDVPGTATGGLYVQSPGSTGAAAVGTPLRIGGTDTSGNMQSIKTDGSGNQIMVGNVGSGAADAGAPIKTGGLANSAAPTAVTAGQRVNQWYGLSGESIAGVFDGTATTAMRGNSAGTYVQGAAASGSPALGNPQRMGFTDVASGTVQAWRGSASDGSGNVQEQVRSAYFSETTTALAASATFTGTARDAGGSILGAPTRWNSFGCLFRADQAGTARMEASNDAGTYFTVQTQAMSALTTYTMTSPIFTRYWRCVVVNGSTAQGSMTVNSRFGL